MSHPLSSPLPPVQPTRLLLPDGAELEIVANVPPDAAGLRMAVRDATLYSPGRSPRHAPGYYSAYVGLSSALHNARAAPSYTNWVIAQGRITAVAGLACCAATAPTTATS